MSGGEQFSLCWDSFHKNLSAGMQSLLESEDLVDVTLAVEGKYLKAHKMVLSLCSPYFRELFSVNPCKHPIVFMKDVSYLALSDLLTFMYQGEVQVNQEHLGTFIKTAEALQIKGLTGDSSNSQESEIPDEPRMEEQKPHRPKTIRTEEEQKTIPRAKKSQPQTAGPSSKRPKLDSKNLVPKVDTSSGTPSSQEILQFKVEPYDAVDHSNIENIDENQGDNFDETVDDSHVDDSEEYSMIEGEEEPQAGTSADGMGDGQVVTYIRGLRHFQIVVNDYKYVKHQSNNDSIYWKCQFYDQGTCKARCVTGSKSKTIVLSGAHTHLPANANTHAVLYREILHKKRSYKRSSVNHSYISLN